MYLTLFDKNEAYENLFYCDVIKHYNKCGTLLVEILNNFVQIKKYLNILIENISNSNTPLEDFEYFSSSHENGISKLYELLNSEIRHLATTNIPNYNNNKTDYLSAVEAGSKVEIINNPAEKQIKCLTYVIEEIEYICSLIEDYTKVKKSTINSNIYNKVIYIPPVQNFYAKSRYNKKTKADSIQLYTSKTRGYSNIKYLTSYKISTCQELFHVYEKLIIEKKICIKKCKNCRKYFITEKRTDELYCKGKSPQNIRKTCKEYSISKTKETYLKSYDIKYYHCLTKQVFAMRKYRAKEEKEKDFYKNIIANYNKIYKKKCKQYNKGKLSKQEFIDWINSYKCNNKYKYKKE